MRRRASASGVALALTACSGSLISGCGGAPPIPTVASATVSRVGTIQPAGGVLSFPAAGGYGGTFVYSSNTASVPVSATMTTSAEPAGTLPLPAPPGTVLAAYTLTLSQTVTFTAWHSLLSTITLPSSVSMVSHTFSEYGYDVTPTGVIGMGSNPGTMNSQSISFGDGIGDVTLEGNHTYLIVLVMK
jgi:hypothetical protein